MILGNYLQMFIYYFTSFKIFMIKMTNDFFIF